jgi:hypothetical protein
MVELTTYTCTRCYARLAILRADHHLNGQEWLYCPVHGKVRLLRETGSRPSYPDPEEFEDDR